MKSRPFISAYILVVALCVGACDARRTSDDGPVHQPIVVQGAMEVEVDAMVAALDQPKEERHSGYQFWRGTLGGYPVIVAKTQKGMTNAAASTALAIELFQPAAIINQGTSGGHDPALQARDIVLGTTSVNIGTFKTGFREKGKGSDYTEWNPMDLLRTDGSAGQDPNAWVVRRFDGDAGLLAAARAVRGEYKNGQVVEGVIGSSDMWNSELDRIGWLHEKFGTTVEEMEAAAAAQVASLSHVPFLGVRILSNNITNGAAYDRNTGKECQQFVLQVVRAYAAQAAGASRSAPASTSH